MNDPQTQLLLEQLKSADSEVRDRATEQLWELWFQQKGMYGYQQLMRAQMLMEARRLTEAEQVLTEVVRDQPDFAEAWNRRAVLYYIQRRYRVAIADCLKVIDLVPIHFGALHGLGLCYAALGEYKLAIDAFHQALEVQPYNLENQRMILECSAKLS
ncbi:MAG: tetratricopeptide repeat protein [Thainema sp.]